MAFFTVEQIPAQKKENPYIIQLFKEGGELLMADVKKLYILYVYDFYLGYDAWNLQKLALGF